jgi:bifunctional non-homologous end joining protein LigD
MPLPLGFIPPCLPTKAPQPPTGETWLHEIKHDGFRVIARKDGARVKLYSRPGDDFTHRFPLIAESLARLRSHTCIIDGEAVACDDKGVASFDLIRHHRTDERVFLYAFDLIELNGDDLRRDPLQVRKATLASILAKARHGIRFNDHIESDGPTVFGHACKMGLERHRVEAQGLALPLGALAALAQDEEPGARCGEAEAEEDWGRP